MNPSPQPLSRRGERDFDVTYETIQFEPGPIARITLNRPDRLNSVTAAMHEELRDALANLGGSRVLIVTGAGRGFCRERLAAAA